VVFRRLCSLAPFLVPGLVLACQGSTTASTRGTPRAAIEARDARGKLVARVVPGHPCRSTIGDIELIVGVAPLVAQVGTDRWTAKVADNGTTFLKNDQAVARVHARQLFDEQGIPLLRVLDNGDIADAANAITRKATVHTGATTTTVTVGDLTVSGTSDVVLAAMLTAREATPEVRALVACHLLLPNEHNRKP